VYDTVRGKHLKVLYTHKSVAVNFLDWNAAREVLISSDTSSRILAHKVQLTSVRTEVGLKPTWRIHRLLELEIEAPIRQILSSVNGEYMLVSDPDLDHAWTLHGNKVLEKKSDPLESTTAYHKSGQRILATVGDFTRCNLIVSTLWSGLEMAIRHPGRRRSR